MSTPSATTSNSTINLISKKQINLDAPNVYINNNLNIGGIVSGINIGVNHRYFLQQIEL
jgi:hypothetical protein